MDSHLQWHWINRIESVFICPLHYWMCCKTDIPLSYKCNITTTPPPHHHHHPKPFRRYVSSKASETQYAQPVFLSLWHVICPIVNIMLEQIKPPITTMKHSFLGCILWSIHHNVLIMFRLCWWTTYRYVEHSPKVQFSAYITVQYHQHLSSMIWKMRMGHATAAMIDDFSQSIVYAAICWLSGTDSDLCLWLYD